MSITETRPWNGKTKAAVQPATPKGPTIADMIDELAVIRAQAKILKARDEKLSGLLKEQLGDGEHKGNKCLVTISTVESERFDTKGFKADQPEWAAKYTKTSSTTTIRFSPLV